SGGNITSDGGSAITARGVCWSTSLNPTTSDSKTTDAGTTGTYTSNLTGLTAGTIYYVRAYATNAVNTVYGTQISFTFLIIGDSYQGGKVAYILVSGDQGYDANVQHGLIAAASDQGSVEWGCDATSISTNTAIGTGAANTAAILLGCATRPIAASLAANYTSGGYADWYLPSKDELNKLFLNRVAIGGFGASNTYWSSTENQGLYAWYHYFGMNFSMSGPTTYGQQNVANKGAGGVYVRAIRSF
ncbi:MAG: hypothetical protein WCL56_11415, partial [Sediminibacterium sp.]